MTNDVSGRLTMTGISRRSLIGGAAAGAAFLALRRAHARPMVVDIPLRPDASGLLSLPEGFSARVLRRTGDMMADMFLTPGRPDGMAAFAGPEGKVLIVCNHELKPGMGEGAFPGAPPAEVRARMFSPAAAGGTTTLMFNPETGLLEKSWLSLAGTIANCAGGPTPWGSWLTCEEPSTNSGTGLIPGHGWVFEVPARADGKLMGAVPLRAMGRFNHEACAVDRNTGIVYMTEDRTDGLFYRYVPDQPGKLAAGGRLEALVVRGFPGLATGTGDAIRTGLPYPVKWAALDGIDSPDDDLRKRGQAAGAATFARGEGLWATDDGDVYFTATVGGRNKAGQIWRYRAREADGTGSETGGGDIELFLEPNDKTVINMCDNLTVTPFGGLLVCEDNDDLNHLRHISRDGKVSTFAANLHPGNPEFAGACFSPDGRWMFVNVQKPGITLAVTGPWERL